MNKLISGFLKENSPPVYTSQHCYHKLFLLGAGLNCNIVLITKFKTDIWGHNIWCFLPSPMGKVQGNTAFPWLHQGKEIWIQKYIQNSKLTREASQRQFHFQISNRMPKQDPAVLSSSALQCWPLSSCENTRAARGEKKQVPEKNHCSALCLANQTGYQTQAKQNLCFYMCILFLPFRNCFM